MGIEDKYDEVKQLISIGKEKGYLLYDEVNDLLPDDLESAADIAMLFDDVVMALGEHGIEVVDSEEKYRELMAQPELLQKLLGLGRAILEHVFRFPHVR